MNKDVLVFGNNQKINQKLKDELCELGFCAEIATATGSNLGRVISQVVEVSEGKQIILVFKNEELKKITEMLHNKGIMDLYVCPWNTHCFGNDKFVLNNCIIPIDNSKPRLDYVEIEVAECCNLNCKGCSEFSNLVDDNKLGDIEETKKDLIKLKELFWGIEKIRLMGGEPLVNPDFSEFIKTAREIFLDSDIRLVSNGLLIPKLKKNDLIEIKNNNCSFDISNYLPTQKIIEAIKAKLDEAEISYNISMPNKYFFKFLLSKPAESPNDAFNNCLFTHCHAVGGGYLTACSNQLYAHRLNTAFALDFPNNDKIDIHHTSLNGWEINDIFARPHDFCRYCGRGMVPYKWETCSKSKVKASDWLIEPTFVNLKVFPILQKIIKSPAKKLRYIIRRPKSKRRK